MDEFNKIRKAYFKEGLSINEIAVKYKRAWQTVKTIVEASRDDIEQRGIRSFRESNIVTPEVVKAC